MRNLRRIVLWAVLVGVTPMIAGCANFDPDSLDIFGLNEKKKLPGQREDLFPGGVPGVTQGIPPEYRKGAQEAPDPGYNLPAEPGAKSAAADTSAAGAAAAESAKPKAKPKPKVRQAARPKPLVLVVGMMNTRPPADFLAPFKPMSPRIMALTIPGEPNAHPAEFIASEGRRTGFDSKAYRSIIPALRDAARIGGARVVICGSLYLAGDILARNGTPPD